MKGMEILQKLADDVEEIKKTLLVLDRNVKQLMNQKAQAPLIGLSAHAAGGEVANSQKRVTGGFARAKTIKVYGNVQRTGGIPIQNVTVTVFDANDKEAAKRITNENGYWQARIPAGDYVVEYSHEKFNAINKVFKINNEMDEYKVV